MEIRVYTGDFDFAGVIENHQSLLWHRVYGSPGDFTLQVPMTAENSNLLQLGRVVWVKGKVEAGVIESREIVRTGRQNVMNVNGRFLETYFNRRLINLSSFTGRVEAAMRQLVTDYPLSSMIELGEDNGFTETVTFQAIYKNMLTYENNLAASAAFGYRMRPDFTNKKIIFEVFKGVDHTAGQYDNTRVIFSDDYENLNDLRRVENDQIYYNVCVVGGQGEGDYKTYVTVGDTETTGINRREMYYEATEIQSNGLTWADYLEALRTRGREILNDHKIADSVECTVLPLGNFIYKTDYDLGDIVTIKKPEWNIAHDLRITEVTEIYESENPSIEIILGTPLPTKINWGAI